MNRLGRVGRLYTLAKAIPRRHRLAYLRSLLPGGSALDEGLPWITFGAIAELEAFLRPDMSVFEWGAGGSTIFFAARAARVVTIEHDPEYRDRVARALAQRGLSADLRLVDAAHYVQAIDAFEDASFDLVAIDGEDRQACMTRAKGKIRSGGRLLLDDSHAREYAAALAAAEPFGARTDHHGVFPANIHRGRFYRKQTSIWAIPSVT